MDRADLDRVRSTLKALVEDSAGGRLPGERQLARQLGVGRQVLRALLANLEALGHIRRRHGAGTWAASANPGPRRITVVVDAAIRLGSDPFFACLVDALTRRFQAAGREVQLVAWDHTLPRPDTDGLILLGAACGNMLAGLGRGDPPTVAWFCSGRAGRGARCSRIRLEDEAAGRAAAAWLIARDCRRIVAIGHERFASLAGRLAGLRAACAECGIPCRLMASGLNLADGLAIAARIRPSRGLGIACLNDWCAAGVAAGLTNRGIAVPLLGFDGLPVAARMGVASFAVPIEAIALDIAAELDRLTADPSVPGRELVYALVPPR